MILDLCSLWSYLCSWWSYTYVPDGPIYVPDGPISMFLRSYTYVPDGPTYILPELEVLEDGADQGQPKQDHQDDQDHLAFNKK